MNARGRYVLLGVFVVLAAWDYRDVGGGACGVGGGFFAFAGAVAVLVILKADCVRGGDACRVCERYGSV